jgi:hypothetical protein
MAFCLFAPAPVAACEPYTWGSDPDGFKLADGLRRAGAGVVLQEIPNPELPGRPLAVVLRIDESISGVSITRLRIEQDAGCEGFWYRTGDHVIAAIGGRAPTTGPPFDGISNYSVAVWVIRRGNVESGPAIRGRVPTTEKQLRALLNALPDTSTASLSAGNGETPKPVLLWFAAVLGALIGRRRARSRSGRDRA